MNRKSKSCPNTVILLILLQCLLGLGAFGGGGALIAAPDGSILGMPLFILEHTPFADFLIPGLILFILLGVYPIAVAWSLWKKPAWRWPEWLNPEKSKHWSWAGSWSAGVILVVWISAQVLLIRAVTFVHALYFIWGWALILLTLTPAVRRYCRKNRQ